jgi:hypothetical protein
MRNYRKKKGQVKTSSTKKTPVQNDPQKVSVKANKASLKSTAIGAMKKRGRPPVAAAKTGAAKPAGAKPTAKPAMPGPGDASSTEDSDKEDAEIPKPVVAAKRAATKHSVKPAAKPPAKPVTKPAATDNEDGSDGEEEEQAPAAKKQKVTTTKVVEIAAETIADAASVKSTTGSKELGEGGDSTVDSSADTSSTDIRMYAYLHSNTVIH